MIHNKVNASALLQVVVSVAVAVVVVSAALQGGVLVSSFGFPAASTTRITTNYSNLLLGPLNRRGVGGVGGVSSLRLYSTSKSEFESQSPSSSGSASASASGVNLNYDAKEEGEQGATTILNPAPCNNQILDNDLLKYVDIIELIPNETELGANMKNENDDKNDIDSEN